MNAASLVQSSFDDQHRAFVAVYEHTLERTFHQAVAAFYQEAVAKAEFIDDATSPQVSASFMPVWVTSNHHLLGQRMLESFKKQAWYKVLTGDCEQTAMACISDYLRNSSSSKPSP